MVRSPTPSGARCWRIGGCFEDSATTAGLRAQVRAHAERGQGGDLPSAGGRDRAAVPVALAELVGDADTLLVDLAAVSGVVRPAERKGRGEPKAGESVALSGAEAV